MRFFTGDSKMHAFMREFHWAGSAIGEPDTWPASLRTIVSLMLDSKVPMFLAWGEELHMIYNDAYRLVIGNKHPSAFCARMQDVWAEVWPSIAPIAKRTMAGESNYFENFPADIFRNGRMEKIWFNFSYSPVRDDHGFQVGMLCVAIETTKQILSEDRQRFQLALSDHLRGLTDARAIIEKGSAMLGQKLGVARVGYVEVDDTEKIISINHDWTNGEISDLSGQTKTLDDFGPLISGELRAGRILAVADIKSDERSAPYVKAYEAVDVRSFLAVPLMKEGHLKVVLHLHQPCVHFWTDQEVSLAEDMIERTRAAAERAYAEERVRVQTEKLRLATEAAELGLFDHNFLTGEIIWSENTYAHFGAVPNEKITLKRLFEHIHPDDRERMGHDLEILLRSTEGGRYQAEYRSIGNGQERWIAARGKVIYDADMFAIRIIGTTADITARKNAEKRLRDAAQHDNLTELPNRSLLYEYCNHILAMSVRAGETCAVLFVDLDRFKSINDLYGHGVGDKVLQEITRRLLLCTRKEDIVSRLGGDEFIVFLPRIESALDAAAVSRHILDSIDAPIVVGGLQLAVTSSIGISLFPEHANDLDQLIRFADLAMYAAKKAGRNNYKMYSAGLNEYADDLLRMELHLKRSLELNGFALVYQPIIDMFDQKIIGVEALIRLSAESCKNVSPNEFIPVAESTGIINQMGDWVIREACRQHQHWLAIGLPPIAIAVNVSPIQFRQPMFASLLESAVRESGIDPAYLQIELTESTVMDNIPATVDTLNKIKAMGICIALDDFGTGYSSLSYLGSLPLDKLKIDQSFIRNIHQSESSRSIIEAIIGLGRILKLKVVGEGVESMQSMAYLRENGCDQAQGFLFSKPLSATEFESWYRSYCAAVPLALPLLSS